MSFSLPLRFLRLAPLALAVGAMTACASGGAPRSVASTQVNALYAQLDQASKSYETALAQAREGNTEASQKTLDGALDQLKQAAAQCGNTAGCDPQRFFSVFDRLLRLKDGSFFAGDDADSLGDGSPESGSTGSELSPVTSALPQVQRSVTLLRGQNLSQLIAMNGPVKAALEMWLTQWRPNLMDAYVNY
ncbi:MAG: lytic transglycosylase, partial [Dyella sp.]